MASGTIVSFEPINVRYVASDPSLPISEQAPAAIETLESRVASFVGRKFYHELTHPFAVDKKAHEAPFGPKRNGEVQVLPVAFNFTVGGERAGTADAGHGYHQKTRFLSGHGISPGFSIWSDFLTIEPPYGIGFERTCPIFCDLPPFYELAGVRGSSCLTPVGPKARIHISLG